MGPEGSALSMRSLFAEVHPMSSPAAAALDNSLSPLPAIHPTLFDFLIATVPNLNIVECSTAAAVTWRPAEPN